MGWKEGDNFFLPKMSFTLKQYKLQILLFLILVEELLSDWRKEDGQATALLQAEC